MYKNKIRLDTFSQVTEFVELVTDLDGEIILTDEDENFKVNARSMLGAMYALEWKDLYVVSEHDIAVKILKFII